MLKFALKIYIFKKYNSPGKLLRLTREPLECSHLIPQSLSNFWFHHPPVPPPHLHSDGTRGKHMVKHGSSLEMVQISSIHVSLANRSTGWDGKCSLSFCPRQKENSRQLAVFSIPTNILASLEKFTQYARCPQSPHS
uniref:Uncharacterized protein n=1 Tax=Myotis myotis TaxID=51298 RepID=A0A7J7XZM8_MYOMY|nr:hypothetical protein mMyoMyo1_011382 [Myotis myotis]